MSSSGAMLSAGAVLIREGLLLPASLKLETSSYSGGWRLVSDSQASLSRSVNASGWNFFFTAGKLEEWAFGSLKTAPFKRALRRILRRVQDLHFNAVQIESVRTGAFFGVIPCISIIAHARHVQQSEQLDNDEQRKIAQEQSAWAIG